MAFRDSHRKTVPQRESREDCESSSGLMDESLSKGSA